MGSDPSSFASLMRTAAVVAPLYFFINSALVAGAIAFSTRQPVVRIWQRNFVWSAPSYLAGAALAAVATAAAARGLVRLARRPGGAALPGLPQLPHGRGAPARGAERDPAAMDVQLATIEALALAIEARAGCTPEHIRSIQHYAGMLAEAAGLTEEEVQGVRTAALLHDIGNMAVPEHILSKPDSLTPESSSGSRFIRASAPRSSRNVRSARRSASSCSPITSAGTASDIPPAARRRHPDRRAHPGDRRLLQHAAGDAPYRAGPQRERRDQGPPRVSGTAFDPALVELFVARLNMATVSPVVANSDETDSAWIEREGLIALQDIAGAHREEQTLYEIAQALGSSLGVADAMALIQEKVSRLVPFVTCALFLGNDEDGYECRYAHGPGTEALFKWQPKSWSESRCGCPPAPTAAARTAKS